MDTFDKKQLSERDICTKYITPALTTAGWDRHTQFLEEVSFTDGRVIVRGRVTARGSRKRADYILYYRPNVPIAVIEAKDNNHSVGDGMQQALDYAETLDVPFAFSTNGDAFLAHDRTEQASPVEQELELNAFPSPDELWERYTAWKGLDDEQERIFTESYYTDATGKTPRYYQHIAINRTIGAIAKGQKRILLVMATGTGKTFVAFQTIWRLWKAGAKKRILFLVDRNFLADQTRTNDFRPFGSAMTKITKRQVDKSYEIYLALYQAVTGTEEWKNIYRQFSPDFFDLVVVDECHRGSADEDSAWHEVLEYFESATHIGMTATPRETKYVSNIHYFGDPVYAYSLKQGIADGFLAPYKVVRIDVDRDVLGWRPEAGKTDKHGRLIEDRVFNAKDMDRSLVLEQRTDLVGRKVTEFLRGTNRYDKTIIFCEDIDHAERMRQAMVNENPDLAADNPRYVMRITGDSKEGKDELDNFTLPESTFPVVATTSRLMSTGIDAQTCKLIVLDRNIQSMTEFKQIIGRGTRINEDYDKRYFTIMDFRKVTELFADPDFDGDPVQIYAPGPDDSPVPPDELEPSEDERFPEPEEDDPGAVGEKPEKQRRVKYYVDDVSAQEIARRVQYMGPDGKLITESLRDYTRKSVREDFASLDEFLQRWTAAEQKQAIIHELEEQGLLLDALAEEAGKDFDPFDLICHVAFDQPPLTRRERAENVRKRNYFTRYGDKARAVLEALLDKYADQGIEHIEDVSVLKVQPFDEFGTPMEIIKAFGGRDQYVEAVRELERQLYSAA